MENTPFEQENLPNNQAVENQNNPPCFNENKAEITPNEQPQSGNQNPQNAAAQNTQNSYYPPSYPPQSNGIYYGYPPSYPPNQPVFVVKTLTPEQQQLRFEKKVLKRTANHIGLSLLFFYMVAYGISFLMGYVSSLDYKIENLLLDSGVNLLLNIIITLLGFVGGALLLLKLEKEKAGSLIPYGMPKGSFLGAVMVGLGFCYTANVAVSLLQTRLENILPFAHTEAELPDGGFGFVLSVLSVAVAPALFEEFLFRGAIMGSLLKYGKAFALFTSAALFGLVHGNLVQIPFAFMVGLVFGFVALETKSIWTAVFVHFLNNLLSVCLDYVGKVQPEEVLSGIYVIMLAVIIGIGLIGVYLLSRKNQNLFDYKPTIHLSTSKQRFGWLCGTATIIIFFVIVGLEILAEQLLAAAGV